MVRPRRVRRSFRRRLAEGVPPPTIAPTASSRTHLQVVGIAKGSLTSFPLSRSRGLRTSPAFTRRAFSFVILFSNSDAGSSRVSCGHQLPPHRQVQNESSQPGDSTRRVGHAVVQSEQALGVHRSSASAKIVLSWSRSAARLRLRRVQRREQRLRIAVDRRRPREDS